jgi:hypothetical protein
MKCPNANDEQCTHPMCTCHKAPETIPNPTNLLSTRELVVELTARLKTGYGVDMVKTAQWVELYDHAGNAASESERKEATLVWPKCAC